VYQEVPIFDLSGGHRGFAMWRLTTPGSTCLTAAAAVTCFRIDLSGQSITDGDPLDCLDTGLRAAEAALPSVAQRIKRLLTPRNPGAGVDVTGTAVEPSSPEDELLRSIDARRSDVPSREPRGRASELAPLRAWWSPSAIIETLDGASLVAATVLDVSGPVTSASGSDVPALLASHARAVKLVTASRTHALRSLGVATAGSVAAAARLRRPGGPLLLLPAVWGFVRRVLDGPS
jgi:hypothetical protein